MAIVVAAAAAYIAAKRELVVPPLLRYVITDILELTLRYFAKEGETTDDDLVQKPHPSAYYIGAIGSALGGLVLHADDAADALALRHEVERLVDL